MRYLNNFKKFKNVDIASIEKQYPVNTKIKNLRHPQVQTILRYEGDNVFIKSDLMPSREFKWSAIEIPRMIKDGEAKLL